MSYLFILLTVLMTVYGQLVLKWQVGLRPQLVQPPYSLANLSQMLLNFWVISAFAAAFGASLFWMAAISRLPLSKAYPFTALNFVLVTLGAYWIFQEHVSALRVAGLGLMIAGLYIASQG